MHFNLKLTALLASLFAYTALVIGSPLPTTGDGKFSEWLKDDSQPDDSRPVIKSMAINNSHAKVILS